MSNVGKRKTSRMKLLNHLREKRKRLERTRQKYLDLFAEDVITRQELEEKLTTLGITSPA